MRSVATPRFSRLAAVSCAAVATLLVSACGDDAPGPTNTDMQQDGSVPTNTDAMPTDTSGGAGGSGVGGGGTGSAGTSDTGTGGSTGTDTGAPESTVNTPEIVSSTAAGTEAD